MGKDDVLIVHPNIKLCIDKTEVCPLCLNGFDNNKNIVVPECGHSMHIDCFCSLVSYKFRHCSVCNKQVIDNYSPVVLSLPVERVIRGGVSVDYQEIDMSPSPDHTVVQDLHCIYTWG